jgi:hypothetical protein
MLNIDNFSVEDIDAELASRYLASAIGENGKSVNCRRKNDSLAKSLAEDMVKGRWNPYVADPIMFDVNGRLQDGQHRMKGVVIASKTNPRIKVRCLVQRNVPLDAFDYVDSGIPRSPSVRTRINRQHCEVYNSIYNDLKSRFRVSPTIIRKMEATLGEDVDLLILKGKQPPIMGNAYIKKAALLSMLKDPKNKEYIIELYEALVMYAKNSNNVDLRNLPPIARAFIQDVFVEDYGCGQRAPSGRQSKRELFAQAMYVFDRNNERKRTIRHIADDSRYIGECEEVSKDLYQQFED